MSWQDIEGAHVLYLAKGAVVVQVALKYEGGQKGYKVKVNNRLVQPLISDVGQAKLAGLAFARKILQEALKEVEEMARSAV